MAKKKVTISFVTPIKFMFVNESNPKGVFYGWFQDANGDEFLFNDNRELVLNPRTKSKK